MVIKPKFRGFICTTAHPEGCAHNVQEQIDYVKSRGTLNGPRNVLVIGASTGYGLASRIVSTFGAGAKTIGVFFEKEASGNRTATAGWYNTAAFEKAAAEEGHYAVSINGDAFSNEIKQQTIERIRQDLGQIDLVVYSLASPKRMHPETGELFSSVIKPVGNSYTNKTVDFHSAEVSDITIEPATAQEIEHTIAVMGGEDWELWMKALKEAGVLAEGVTTVAYSYIGPQITHSIYREGTIGRAKDHLEATAGTLNHLLEDVAGRAFVSVNKALVTQSSSAIPVVPLYISLLFKVMKEKGLHEGTIEQMYRLFADRLYAGSSDALALDEQNRIRIDDWEMREDVQQAVAELWNRVDSDNIRDISDIDEFRKDFFRLFGFEFAQINYEEEVEPVRTISSLTSNG